MKIGMFQSIDISRAGLRSERQRLNAVADNIANVKTSMTEDGSYYRPKEIASQSVQPENTAQPTGTKLQLRTEEGHISGGQRLRADYQPGGVESEIVESDAPPVRVFDPDHPHVGADGFVEYPDIDLPEQMGEAITAIRAYEANIGVIDAAKYMFKKALEI